VRISAVALPAGAHPVISGRDFVLATISGSSAQAAEEAAAAEATEE
jgi:hypothetical protein